MIQLQAGRTITESDRAQQPVCCKLLVPSYGNVAQGRAGVKVTTATRNIC